MGDRRVSREIEWLTYSGRLARFPEAGRAEWFTLDGAQHKIVKGQCVFLDCLPSIREVALPIEFGIMTEDAALQIVGDREKLAREICNGILARILRLCHVSGFYSLLLSSRREPCYAIPMS
jgi:hypothetical protein